MAQTLPGIWREGSRSEAIPLADAQQAWAAAAIPVLVDRAKAQKTVTYSDLAERIQEVAQIRTTMLLSNWIGRVLNVVLHYAADKGLPSVTSLVVSSTDDEVSTGFDAACLRTRGHKPSSKQQRHQWAAEDRQDCYRFWASSAEVTELGHRDRPRPAQMPRPAQAPRPKQTPRLPSVGQEAVSRPVCPSCGTELPLTGRCDYCD